MQYVVPGSESLTQEVERCNEDAVEAEYLVKINLFFGHSRHQAALPFSLSIAHNFTHPAAFHKINLWPLSIHNGKLNVKHKETFHAHLAISK